MKTPEETKTVMTELVLPNDTNLLGNLLGGTLMHWIDIAGAMAATRHSNKIVATAALDSLDFRHPIRLGEMVILTSKILWCGRTSMKLRVTVEAENMYTGNRITTNEAYITFVAMDKDGKPAPVPPLSPQTEAEQEDYDRCQQEYLARKQK